MSWPNLFKLNPSTLQRDCHQITTSSNICIQNWSANEGTSSQEEEYRKPEPKPARWNPLPEQIQILEGIFGSGMVRPPPEQIQKITKQLQQYGAVGDANVFYWFQNKKSKSKRKQRHPQGYAENSKSTSTSHTPLSSVDQCSYANNNAGNFIHESIGESSSSALMPCYASFPRQYLSHQQREGIIADQYLNMQIPATVGGGGNHIEARCPDRNTNGISCLPQAYTATLLLNETQAYPNLYSNHLAGATDISKTEENLLTSTLTYSTIVHARKESSLNTTNATLFSVFINGIPFDAPMEPINVKAMFGENAILVHSSGQSVPVDEHGFTLQCLQGGAMYYLVHV